MLVRNYTEFSLDLFTIINISLLLVSTVLLISVVRFKKHAIIMPSFILLFYTYIFFQLPFAYYSFEVEKTLPNPFLFLFYLYGFVFIGLLSIFTYKSSSKKIWENLNKKDSIFPSISFSIFFLTLTMLCFIIYSFYIPFSDITLFKFFSGADVNAIESSRESTLKTLDASIPKYTYSIGRSCLAVALTSTASYNLVKFYKEGKLYYMWACFLIIIFALAYVSIVLTKSSAAIALLAIFFSLYYNNIYSNYKAFLILMLGFLFSFFLCVLVAGAVYGAEFAFLTSIEPVLERTFSSPFRMCIWYAHYAQTYGTIGISSVQKLAPYFGEESINVANLIGKTYAPIYYNHPVIESISANAGFLFSNYLAWGLWGLPLSLLMLFSLDLGLLFMKRLSKEYLVPLLSIISVQLISFTASGYGVSMLTHGYLPTFIIFYSYIKWHKNIFSFIKREMIKPISRIKRFSQFAN